MQHHPDKGICRPLCNRAAIYHNIRMEKKLSREEAWELLTEYTKTPALLKHALAVEAVTARFARLDGEDEEVWDAAGLMRPSKSVLDLEVKSVQKKFKDKSFAAGVNRDVVRSGCEMREMELDDVIRVTIEGMKEKAEEIGLKGIL